MSEIRQLKYFAAILEGIDQSMARDPSVFLIGEGVCDPKAIFNTTQGLAKKYGRDRVMEMPVSENGLTGVCIGAALRGLRPVMTHQRVDFALLALDQIINNAAKWHFMFGGQASVPLVIRLLIGQGWGQGAQHSQNLQALFAHIPGLKVIMPATPHDAKGLLVAAIDDNNPVICLEHRWLYNLSGNVPEEIYRVPLGRAHVMRSGNDVTVVASSLMAVESFKAAKLLETEGVDVEIVDLRTIKPLDEATILTSVRKTGRVLVADSGSLTGGMAGEIISRIAQKAFQELKSPPQRITLPDIPSPSTPALTKDYYPDSIDIAERILDILGKDKTLIARKRQEETANPKPHDVPDPSFTGPF